MEINISFHRPPPQSEKVINYTVLETLTFFGQPLTVQVPSPRGKG